MSIVEDKILSRLNSENKPEHRLTVLISASKVEDIKLIAKAMSEISGQRVTQTMLFEDAVDAYIEECMANPELRSFLLPPEQAKNSQDMPSGDPAGEAIEQYETESIGPIMSL